MATTTPTPTRTSILIKLSLPHVALVLFYFLYLFVGSLIFHAIESEPQKQSLKDVKEAEDKKIIEIKQFSMNYTGSDSDQGHLQELLDDLVEIVTHRDWIAGRFDVYESPNPWGIPSAMLFCMTTITTIGETENSLWLSVVHYFFKSDPILVGHLSIANSPSN